MNAVAKSPPPQDVAHARIATSDGTWHPTTAAEMQAYIGVNMAMGFKDLPEYKDYWATDPILHDPFISSVLSRQRYEKLCQYLDCSILTNKEADDELAKIRPLINKWSLIAQEMGTMVYDVRKACKPPTKVLSKCCIR